MGKVTSEAAEAVALGFDRSGRGWVRAATLGGIGLTLAGKRRWHGLAAFAATEALTPIAGNAIKLVIARERPVSPRVDPFGTSFPSGHTSYAAATAVAVVLLAADDRPVSPAAWAAAAAVITGMAWSRTHLQAHWLSDVIAGAALGAGVSLATFAVADRRQARRALQLPFAAPAR